jgi:hypothetical protein
VLGECIVQIILRRIERQVTNIQLSIHVMTNPEDCVLPGCSRLSGLKSSLKLVPLKIPMPTVNSAI